MTTAAGSPVPWRPEELVRLVAFQVVAVCLLGGAWYGAGQQLQLADQVGALDLAVGGIVLAGVANARWLGAGRRVVGLRTLALRQQIEAELVPASAETPRAVLIAPTSAFVQALGMTRVHLPACPLMTGKPAVGVAVTDGLPCGVCQP